jgi:hypothetical protein
VKSKNQRRRERYERDNGPRFRAGHRARSRRRIAHFVMGVEWGSADHSLWVEWEWTDGFGWLPRAAGIGNGVLLLKERR